MYSFTLVTPRSANNSNRSRAASISSGTSVTVRWKP